MTHTTRMGLGPRLRIIGTGTHHVQHAQHRGDRRLVVVRARSAVCKALVHRCGAQQKQRKGRQNTEHPEDMASGQGHEGNDLHARQNSNGNGQRPAQALDKRVPLGKLGTVEVVLTRRVIVGDDHDGTVALDHIGASRAVNADDVLAARAGAGRRKEVGAVLCERKQDE